MSTISGVELQPQAWCEKALDWIGTYEQWVSQQFEPAYRETLLEAWPQRRRYRGGCPAASFDEWLSGEAHRPETEEYGVSSFVYRARRPFHPQRLMDLLESDVFDGVLRSKGFVWLASQPDLVGVWSQAGELISLNYSGDWWSAVPREEWPDDPALVEAIQCACVGEYGDRRQELVIIGIDLKREHTTRALNVCLLTETEMVLGQAVWQNWDDPFNPLMTDEENTLFPQ